MDNRGGRKIDYIELIRAIAAHWKPVFQNKQFRRAMLKCIVGTITFTAFWLFLFSLNPTGKALGELMKEIEPPPGAVKMGGAGMRNGVDCLYKFPGMSGEEVRLYYKTELKKKNGSIKERMKMETISM